MKTEQSFGKATLHGSEEMLREVKLILKSWCAQVWNPVSSPGVLCGSLLPSLSVYLSILATIYLVLPVWHKGV